LGLKTEKGKSMAASQGHTQTKIIGPDGRDGVRVPLGHWSGEWDQFREEPWHGPLYSAFKNSMSALQRHEQADTAAAMAKASNAPPVPQDERERFEFRHLDREMGILEAANIDATMAAVAARRDALSPFAAPLDKADVPRATVRAEIRAHIKSLAPDKARAFLREADETTAAAVLEGPAFLSGLSPEQHANFREARLQKLHPEKLASLDAANAAAKLVRRSLDAARQSTRVRIAPFLPPVEIEPKTVTAPWVS
jgi:hypothetical protein